MHYSVALPQSVVCANGTDLRAADFVSHSLSRLKVLSKYPAIS